MIIKYFTNRVRILCKILVNISCPCNHKTHDGSIFEKPEGKMERIRSRSGLVRITRVTMIK